MQLRSICASIQFFYFLSVAPNQFFLSLVTVSSYLEGHHSISQLFATVHVGKPGMEYPLSTRITGVLLH